MIGCVMIGSGCGSGRRTPGGSAIRGKGGDVMGDGWCNMIGWVMMAYIMIGCVKLP